MRIAQAENAFIAWIKPMAGTARSLYTECTARSRSSHWLLPSTALAAGNVRIQTPISVTCFDRENCGQFGFAEQAHLKRRLRPACMLVKKFEVGLPLRQVAGSWRDACNRTMHFPWLHFESPEKA